MSWKDVPIPAKKADYRFKHLRLLAVPPRQQLRFSPQPELPVKAGDVAMIYARRSWAEADAHCHCLDISLWPHERVLELMWDCGHCHATHHILIPEAWIAEGKTVFVEQTDEDSHA